MPKGKTVVDYKQLAALERECSVEELTRMALRRRRQQAKTGSKASQSDGGRGELVSDDAR